VNTIWLGLVWKCLSPEQRVVWKKARAIIDQAKAAFRSLTLDRNNPAYIEAESIAGVTHPTWEELFSLEMLILHLSTREALDAQSQTIRDQYDRLPKPDGWQDRRDFCKFKENAKSSSSGLTGGVDTKKDEESRLRIELIYKLREIQWDLRKSIDIEVEMEKLRWQTGLIAIAVVVSLLCLLHRNGVPDNARTTCWAMAFGMLGATTSLFRRMSNPSALEVDVRYYTPYKNVTMLLGGNADVWFSLASGLIFSALLVQLSISGLLDGSLFPVLADKTKHCATSPDMLAPAEYAKLAVWSFIAGFAETFVPDVLNRLTGKGRHASGLSETQK